MPQNRPLLTVVPTVAPDASESRRVRLREKPSDAIQCRCGGREFFELVSGPKRRDGRLSGGTRQWACVACWLKGERVIVT